MPRKAAFNAASRGAPSAKRRISSARMRLCAGMSVAWPSAATAWSMADWRDALPSPA